MTKTKIRIMTCFSWSCYRCTDLKSFPLHRYAKHLDNKLLAKTPARERVRRVGGVEVVAHCVHRQDIARLTRADGWGGADEGLRVCGDSSEILSGYAAVHAFSVSCPAIISDEGWLGWLTPSLFFVIAGNPPPPRPYYENLLWKSEIWQLFKLHSL